jgi:hypothetical protein
MTQKIVIWEFSKLTSDCYDRLVGNIFASEVTGSGLNGWKSVPDKVRNLFFICLRVQFGVGAPIQ